MPREPKRTLEKEYRKDGLFRVLSLDGGGAKGFYTLGVLKEIEGMLKCPLYQCFDLIFGTSTGSIIGALIALGYEVDEILSLYREHVPAVLAPWLASGRSAALKKLGEDIFGEATFEDVKTKVGVVATNWLTEKPMIFKGDVRQAHGRVGTFVPGFGATIAEAVRASCSAYPFFKRQHLKLTQGNDVELGDGGFCANNPTLYAIADATRSLNVSHDQIRVVSLGVGVYPQPKGWLPMRIYRQCSVSMQLLQKLLEINTQSMEQLNTVLFPSIRTVRISDTFSQPEMATDFMEYDVGKLDVLFQRGHESFGSREGVLREYLVEGNHGNP
jgi:predicted acylesterase/phospholipase RssA